MNIIKKLRGENGSGVLAEADRGLSLFRREIDRAFERTRRAFERSPWHAFDDGDTSWPAIDVKEDEKAFSVRVDVPGLEPKDVDVEVSGNLLTVKGSREGEHEEKEKNLYRYERFAGNFARSVTLPATVDPSRVEAQYDKGVLIVTAPKIPGKEPKKIPVKPEQVKA
jgi:HSP20 family protein